MKLNLSSFTTTEARTLFYSLRPGEGPPLVLLNGLSDSLDSWIPVIKNLSTQRPLLLVDLPGQGQSLEKELADSASPDFLISIESQVQALQQLLQSLNISEYGLIGFSYGGGVALKAASLFPDQITDLILILPFMLRLDLSLPLSRVFKSQYDFFKLITPKEFRMPFEIFEKSYDRFTHRYMNFRYLKRIPSERHRQAAIELSQGIMKFNSFEITHLLPDQKLIVMSAGMDTLIPSSLYNEFWYRISSQKKKAWVHFKDGEHLILEQAPESVAHYLNLALANQLDGTYKVNIETFKYAHTD